MVYEGSGRTKSFDFSPSDPDLRAKMEHPSSIEAADRILLAYGKARKVLRRDKLPLDSPPCQAFINFVHGTYQRMEDFLGKENMIYFYWKLDERASQYGIGKAHVQDMISILRGGKDMAVESGTTDLTDAMVDGQSRVSGKAKAELTRESGRWKRRDSGESIDTSYEEAARQLAEDRKKKGIVEKEGDLKTHMDEFFREG